MAGNCFFTWDNSESAWLRSQVPVRILATVPCHPSQHGNQMSQDANKHSNAIIDLEGR